MEISINPEADRQPSTFASLSSAQIKEMSDLYEACAKLDRNQQGSRVARFLEKQAKSPKRETDTAGVFTTADGDGIYYQDDPQETMSVVLVDNRFADPFHKGRGDFTVWLIAGSLTSGRKQKAGDFRKFPQAYQMFLKQIQSLTPVRG
jgi:hypothetical protein